MREAWTFPIDSGIIRRIARHERLAGLLARTRSAGLFRRLARSFDAQAVKIERRRADEAYRSGSKPAGYTGLKEEMTFFTYKAEVESPKFAKIRSPSYALYQEQERLLTELLARANASPFINFGVSFAHIDAIMARKFPDTQFIGVDRSRYTKALNEVDFGSIPNLRFEAADISDVLKLKIGGTLFHSRTMCLIKQEDAFAIYKQAAASGVRYVAGFEMLGLPRETLKPYQFSLKPQPTVHFRHFMFIHNYPWMLREAGFEIEQFHTIETNSPHKDLRMLCFIAKQAHQPK